MTLVLAAAKPWHYWISFVLVASVIAVFLALTVMYLWRITVVKYGMRQEK